MTARGFAIWTAILWSGEAFGCAKGKGRNYRSEEKASVQSCVLAFFLIFSIIGSFLYYLSGIFLLTILAPISFRLLIRKIEHMRKFLFDGGNAARVFALDHIGDGFWKA